MTDKDVSKAVKKTPNKPASKASAKPAEDGAKSKSEGIPATGPGPYEGDEFIELILGAPLEFTAADVAKETGVSEEITRTFWRALGFADVGSSRAFTKRDIEALRSILRLVKREMLSIDQAIEVARAIGQSTARLAEWQSNTIGANLEDRGVIGPPGTLSSDDYPDLLAETRIYKPVMERLLVYSWRRQMAAGAARALAAAEAGDDARTDQMSVGFADLVGFTRLSRQIPEDDLARLVQTFETVSADIVAGTGARLVKTLGDEVLFVNGSAEIVAETAVRLHEAHRTSQQFPRMRIGLATGSVVLRMGDVYGTTVNRASRLTAMAKPGGTFIDATTLDELEDTGKFSFKTVRPRPARGFGLLRAWSMNRAKV